MVGFSSTSLGRSHRISGVTKVKTMLTASRKSLSGLMDKTSGSPFVFFFPGFFGRMVVVPLNKVMAKMLLSPDLFVVYGCYSCIMLYHDWLVVWNMNFISPSIGYVIIPTDGSYFSGGLLYHQPDDVSISRYCLERCHQGH